MQNLPPRNCYQVCTITYSVTHFTTRRYEPRDSSDGMPPASWRHTETGTEQFSPQPWLVTRKDVLTKQYPSIKNKVCYWQDSSAVITVPLDLRKKWLWFWYRRLPHTMQKQKNVQLHNNEETTICHIYHICDCWVPTNSAAWLSSGAHVSHSCYDQEWASGANRRCATYCNSFFSVGGC